MTERTDKNFDNSAGPADEGSSGRIAIDELEKRLEANPRFTKVQRPDDEDKTTVTFLSGEAAARAKAAAARAA